MKKETSNEIKITVKEQKQVIENAVQSILSAAAVKKYLAKSKHRVLAADFFAADEKEKKYLKCQSNFSDFNRLTVYDYTRNCCVFIQVKAWKPLAVDITESAFQPEPNDEEFNEAVEMLARKYPRVLEGIKEKLVRIYRPMPPTIDVAMPTGEVQRTIAVGIKSSMREVRNEIAGVNMITNEITHFKNGSPDNASALDDACGLPDASQPTTSKGIAGESWITVTQGGVEIWKLLVVRPSASSGTKGSGVELKFVNYKKKRVLYQAHVPILNVRYDNDACGPYRDWQWQESMFTANGVDKAPGIRICPTPAQTILDSENDNGNFKGVAIYVQGQEVVLVSEMEAGWYRYISEWRLHTNGTISPRFGFSAVQNSCVCNKHHHHAYWRFDFDIETPSNNLVEEFNDPILIGNSNWHKKTYEIKRAKDSARKRKWRITNTISGSSYEIIPGANDGTLDSFGVGDLWVLRYHGGSEIDDGVTNVGGTPDQCKAHIDKFVNEENVENKDVVIWYGAHFTHDIHAHAGHIVGPTLKCVKW
jgi:Copper amine oxidase, enzyme domain